MAKLKSDQHPFDESLTEASPLLAVLAARGSGQ
jgi:hypothetical protein